METIYVWKSGVGMTLSQLENLFVAISGIFSKTDFHLWLEELIDKKTIECLGTR